MDAEAKRDAGKQGNGDGNGKMNQIDKLLNTPYWVIDILPAQVPKDSPGQYFTIEDYLLKNRIAEIKQKHIDIILKLNCYRDISIEEELNPPPEKISGIMRERYVYIMVGNSMILSEPDDTHLTLFNPDEELLDLIRSLSPGEGLFVWKP